ncbi:unnamed protein product [Closterium sp. NIES-54]
MVTRHRTTGEHIQSIEGMQFVDGYLLKVVSIKSLDTRGVVPTLDELQRFQRAAGDGERGEYGGGGAGLGSGVGPMGLSAEQANRQRGRLVKGDVVEVVEGDLKGLKGRVEKVDDDEVIIRPHHDELKDLLPVKESQLRKFFQTGDHVKVVAGQNDGVTGMIVKVEGHIAIVLSDTSREHVRVFTRDLMSSSEVTAGPSQIGDYELHDLVLLDQTTAGVIVKVEKTGCVVLKATPERSETVAVKLREIRRKMNNRHVSAHDAEGLPVVAKDPVRVVEGTYRDRRGTVEHIHRGVLFVFDRHHVENGGFFCVRARSVRCLTAKAAAATGLSIPVIVFSPVDSPSLSQRNSAGAGGGGGASTMAPLIRSFGGVMQSPSRFLQSWSTHPLLSLHCLDPPFHSATRQVAAAEEEPWHHSIGGSVELCSRPRASCSHRGTSLAAPADKVAAEEAGLLLVSFPHGLGCCTVGLGDQLQMFSLCLCVMVHGGGGAWWCVVRGGAWWCVVRGGAWWCVAMRGVACWCMVVCGRVWRCMVVCGGAWWCMVVCGGAWWCSAEGSIT